MSAIIADGKGIASAVLTNLKTQLDALSEPLHLVAVCAGDDPGLKSFVKLKQKAAESVGIVFSSYFFDADDQEGAASTLQFLAGDESVHGIFVELPLPPTWDTEKLIALIPPEKDVDALTGKSAVAEPAVLAVQYLFHEYAIEPSGLTAAVIGQGRLVGAPISRWLSEQGCNVLPIDITTTAPETISRIADLVIAGTGKPGLVTGDWIKEGALVVDFGYGDGKGDVDAESVKHRAALLTPVPGGMGPLLIAAVLENLLALSTS